MASREIWENGEANCVLNTYSIVRTKSVGKIFQKMMVPTINF